MKPVIFMFTNRLFNVCFFFAILFALIGCASTQQGGFRITDGSGQKYYARSIDFVGVKGFGTFNVRGWGAKEFNKLGLPYIENGGGWGLAFLLLYLQPIISLLS